VVLKEPLLILERQRDTLGLVDIPLSSVDDRDVPQPQRDNSTSENIHHVRPLIHQVHLGQDTDRPCSLRIHLARHFQTVRVGQVGIRAGDREDDGIGLGDEPHEHVTDLLFDIARLVPDRDFGETGEIDQGEGEDVGREDSEVDGVGGDA
jgi:hypothetical protein